MSHRRRSLTLIAASLALVAGQAGAQETERQEKLLEEYPVLAELENKECLPRLTVFSETVEDKVFARFMDGKFPASEFPKRDKELTIDEDLADCLSAVEEQIDIAQAEGRMPGRGKGKGKGGERGAKAEDAPGKSADAKDADAPKQGEGAGNSATVEQSKGEVKATGEAEMKAEEKTAEQPVAAASEDASEKTGTPEQAAADKSEKPEQAAEGRGAEKKKDRKAEKAATSDNAEAKVSEDDKGEQAAAADAVKEETAKTQDTAAKAETEATAKSSSENAATSDDEAAKKEELAKSREESEKTEPEAVQKDTEAAAEAANEKVEVAATKDAKAEEVEVVEVTEETARSSSEDFKPLAKSSAAAKSSSKQDDDNDTLKQIGAAAAGVIGGVVLNELLGSNEEVAANTGDRIVIKRGSGDYYVLKDESALLRRPGARVETQRFADGSLRETVTRRNGVQVVTVRAPNGQVVRRERILPDGRSVLLFDDSERFEPIDLSDLPRADVERVEVQDDMDAAELRRLLAEKEADRAEERTYSLRQIREIRAVRNLVPLLELEAVTFETGSAAIRPSEAQELSKIGFAMREMIEENPYEVFLIEGHTDAVGSAAFNLALSDRRAESVALALTEYFEVPPENMVVQGYGESNLRIPTQEPERLNRRAAVRRITPLLRTASSN